MDGYHAFAGRGVARTPADLLAELARRQRPGLAGGVAGERQGCRAQRDAYGEHQRAYEDYRVAAVDGPSLEVSSGGDEAVEAVDDHDDRAACEDRGDVGQEE
jgi:hypothetical protein